MNPLVLLLRGILALVLGLILIIWPGATLNILLILFPIFAVIDGTSAIIIGLKTAKEGRWLSFIPMGVLEIMIGIFVFAWPQATVVAFVYLMALWAFVLGISEFFIAVGDQRISPASRWLYLIAAVITFVLGVLVISYPIMTSVLVLWLFGVFFLAYGIILLTLGILVSLNLVKEKPKEVNA